RADLIARDKSGVLWLYKGTGNPAKPFEAMSRVGGGWSAFNALADTGDLTRDGRADLIARDKSGVLWLYKGKAGDAPFAALSELRGTYGLVGVASAALRPLQTLRALKAGPATRAGQPAFGPGGEERGCWAGRFYSGWVTVRAQRTLSFEASTPTVKEPRCTTPGSMVTEPTPVLTAGQSTENSATRACCDSIVTATLPPPSQATVSTVGSPSHAPPDATPPSPVHSGTHTKPSGPG
ncbi:FG-GAP repeat domain-containing protein, partial [Streptomyces parvulus]